ncbi:MAG TPA: Ldh family oxidoreductase, partial [Micropepsaceae bacterium]|nr:Ldh family oxidoreductase [Micropepsaceae bacterium]
MTVLSFEAAEDLVAAALHRSRTSEPTARIVAHALVSAEADGLKSHGLLRVPMYAAQAKCGKVDGFATPSVERVRPGLLSIDAKHGFAYPAMNEAISRLPVMARELGIAAAAIRRSHHVGVAGHPVERLAKDGMVAMMFANAPAAMAP